MINICSLISLIINKYPTPKLHCYSTQIKNLDFEKCVVDRFWFSKADHSFITDVFLKIILRINNIVRIRCFYAKIRHGTRHKMSLHNEIIGLM